MTDLNYDPVNNIGGLYRIRFVPVAGITPTLATGTPNFRDGFRFYTAYGTESTRLYEERQSTSDNGPIWDLTVSAFLPGDNPERRTQLAEMVRHRFIIQCEDNNGLLRQVGSYDQPLELSYQFVTGKAVSDLRGYALTFRGSLSQAPAIL